MGAAALVALDILRPPPPPTVDVVVLARPAVAGSVLSASDLEVRGIPIGLAPEAAVTALGDAVGRRLAVALPAGYPLAPGVIVGPGLADGAPPGTVVVPVRLADAGVARLLAAGDRVDLVRAPPEGGGSATVVARGALVLARAEDGGGSGGAGFFGTTDDAAPLLLVAAAPDAARLVAGAGSWAPLSAVLVAP